ncbi:MAG: adenylate/guanylate cyclase domain-containing protein [Proteobacteria bacterium]|nr:adenylate/guanylate cyclase domain-containing protein [Pseudomonadota bacterium]
MMGEQPPLERKLTTILAADVVGYSRLTAADEEGTLTRLKALRRELIDPSIAVHHGRIVKTTGDGILIEFASVVDAVRSAIEVQRDMARSNAKIPPERRIEFRVGINLGDVVVEGDDLLGDGVNVAARLEGIAPAGGICISASAYDQVRDKIEAAFADMGEQRLKNIARPVRVFRVELNGATSRARSPASSRATRVAVIAVGVVALLLIGGGAWYLRGGVASSPTITQVRQTTTPKPAPRLSIVVLPFANLSGDPQQEYFADGLTEDLTTDLSRISGSFVISRNTAFTFKGKPVSATDVGRDLGVRYVLEGSVRRSGNQVRVNAQLIDSESGAHLWADRFDYELRDVLVLQSIVTGRIARTLSIELVDAESDRSKRERPNDPDAVDLELQARAVWARTGQGGNKVPARELFGRALQRDDRLSAAWSGLALTYLLDSRFSPTRDDDLAKAEGAVNRALALDSKDASGYHARGILNYELGNIERAIADYEKAIALDRNRANSWAQIAAAKVLLGEPQQAFQHIDRAIELSPRDPQLPVWHLFKGVAYLHLEYDGQAIEWLRKSTQMNPRDGFAHLFLSSALALAGRGDEARAETQEFLRITPGFTLASFKAREPSKNALFLVQRQRVYEGLRKAGLPEG